MSDREQRTRLDPTKTWRMVEERLARETEPRRRQLLENVLAHMKAESAGDLDGLMATLAPNPQYHQWRARMLVVWPYDADGMLLAEDAYTATDGFANLRKLGADELPEALVSS